MAYDQAAADWQTRAEQAEAELARAHAERGAEQDVMHNDLAAILRALGLGDQARPKSPHQVVQGEVLPTIHRLTAAAPEPTGEYLRVGSQVGRTVYRCTPDDPKGHLVGVMDTPELAAEIVTAANRVRYGPGEGDHA